MIRLALPGDAIQLFGLNERFNGPGSATVEDMARSLESNTQEMVVVSDRAGVLTGFVCVQIKRSFCYKHPTAEVTEVFVDEPFRRKGLAKGMLCLALEAAKARFGVTELTVLTGGDNLPAQALYEGAGFLREDEVVYQMASDR